MRLRDLARLSLLAAAFLAVTAFDVVPDYVSKQPPFWPGDLERMNEVLSSGTNPLSKIVKDASVGAQYIRIGTASYKPLEFTSVRPRIRSKLSVLLRRGEAVDTAMIEEFCREDVKQFIEIVGVQTGQTLPGNGAIVTSLLRIRYPQNPRIPCVFLFGEGIYERR